jgi:hypothetical protein
MQPFSFHSSGLNKDESVYVLLSVVVLSVDESGTSIVSMRGNQNICLWNKKIKLYWYILDLAVTYWNWCSSGCTVITPLAGRSRNRGSISKTSRPNCPLSLLFSGYKIIFRSDSGRSLKLKIRLNIGSYRRCAGYLYARYTSVLSVYLSLIRLSFYLLLLYNRVGCLLLSSQLPPPT